ncbi:hypothetical protein [Edaphobacter sp.]|uniref:hypothetical protein n=1 Tax=Edaphobacter sp. TaxID=1934404 RepID=UPI002DBF43D6|nr:hypothetical protein [Edaphobacter sp.]HEU5341890.1 hypothetical protein [Edaphobacter sp.]
MDILKPRAKPTFALPEAFSLLGFCILLAWCIPHHESWFDEAQAWLIARDSSLRDLLLHRLHYEGAPALWHLLLWIEARLLVSFLGMHYIAGALSAFGIYIWLRFNPLPRVLSLLVPFTFFLQYQYAVIARSYSLFPLFAFALFALYQNRKSSPITFCVIAGLLANCSLHMAAFAAGAVLFYAADRRQLQREGSIAVSRRQLSVSAVVLLLAFGVSAFVARPTPDGSFGNPVVQKIGSEMPGSAHEVKAEPLADKPIELPPAHQGRIARKIWRAVHPAANASHRAVIESKLVKHLLEVPAALTAPISTSNLLAILFLVLLALNLTRQQLWLSLAPYALVLFVFVCIQGASHHLGLLWIGLLCSIWALSIEPASSREASHSLRSALYLVTLIVIMIQIGWSIHCIRADIFGAYAPDEETAAFISRQPPGTRIAAFDLNSITANAYLPKSRYFNQRVSYWPFSKTADPSLRIQQTMAQRPDMVIESLAISEDPYINQWLTVMTPGTKDYDPATFSLLAQDGYRETHRFCGEHLFRGSSEQKVCRVVFEAGAAGTSSLR